MLVDLAAGAAVMARARRSRVEPTRANQATRGVDRLILLLLPAAVRATMPLELEAVGRTNLGFARATRVDNFGAHLRRAVGVAARDDVRATGAGAVSTRTTPAVVHN